ncbi:MAG TPA: hypothetical protein VHE33_17050 [Acidobacteriaceae bacterium]|nr:hypothetical protein [Acidobacteriaceae bacterium]
MNFLKTCLQAVLNFFSEILFGCTHTRVTRPFTLGSETYEVCLDCGKQIYYSATEMRRLTPFEVRRLKAARAGEVKVVPINTPHLVPRDRKPNVAA